MLTVQRGGKVYTTSTAVKNSVQGVPLTVAATGVTKGVANLCETKQVTDCHLSPGGLVQRVIRGTILLFILYTAPVYNRDEIKSHHPINSD